MVNTVYKFHTTTEGKDYVGLTGNLEKRLKAHRRKGILKSIIEKVMIVFESEDRKRARAVESGEIAKGMEEDNVINKRL